MSIKDYKKKVMVIMVSVHRVLVMWKQAVIAAASFKFITT